MQETAELLGTYCSWESLEQGAWRVLQQGWGGIMSAQRKLWPQLALASNSGSGFTSCGLGQASCPL